MSADLGLLQCLVNQQDVVQKVVGDLQEKGFRNARVNDPYVLRLVEKNLPAINPALLVPVSDLGTDRVSPKLRAWEYDSLRQNFCSRFARAFELGDRAPTIYRRPGGLTERLFGPDGDGAV